GDSVDVSTFRAVPVVDLSQQVERALLTRLPPALQRWASAVMDYLVRQRCALTTSDRLLYLATLAEQGSEAPSIIGGALYALGLVPDFDLLHRPDEMNY